ncbi:hemolysin-III channel protein-like protein Izh2 [Coniochaeta ligniaria NRRL 30616]|uniref:Hemolysin-III channel protein-like protein Izh2 n=1 Tax=Coniochaeta ligniaria NRRL 30616 TaxID=1408157 RepID=A0A1J7J7M0_9PEZI|nr:hemolysin-III channel protein-like protein Izh2 [Coniochaeta ligniaria NRRL 30616]
MAPNSPASLEMATVSAIQESQQPNSNAVRSSSNMLISWSDLPAWQQEESYCIERGYRKAEPSVRLCLHSLTYIHNETVSIYSHATGVVLFIILHVCFFTSESAHRHRLATSGDMIVLTIYFVSVTLSFMLSAVIHTFRCHSEKASKLGKKFDFQGLVLMIWGATVALIYYAFVCDLELQVRYWTVTSVAALFCSFFNLQPRFSKSKLQPFRALSLGCLSLSFFVPVIHSLVAYGLSIQTRRLALQWMIYALICHTFCAAAHATEFPERFFPRTYDIFGASHQIFHIMLLAGAITYTIALSQQFDFLHNTATTCAIM